MKINSPGIANFAIAALLLALPIGLTAAGELPPAADITVDFDQHVRPLLAAKCHSCHGEKQQQAGLRLDKRQNALRGGDYGPVIVRGNGAESKLIKRLVSGDGGMQMPPTGPLEAEEIGILRAWIDQGAEFGDVDFEVAKPRKPVDPKVRELIDAVRKHEITSVKGIVKSAPEHVNGRDSGGSTPLHHAAGFGTLETMKRLIEAGAEVDARNDRNSTPLHWAVSDIEKMRLLLARGAEIDAKTERERTPLSLAASLRFDIAPLKLLLDKGANPNIASINGQTPLMSAAGAGNVEAMELLLAKKADPLAVAGSGAVALIAAAASRNPEAVKLLLEYGADVNAKTKRNQTAIFGAASRGAEDVVKLLLEEGAEVNIQDYQGHSPLLFAAMSESMSAPTVRMLLEKGAKTDVSGHGVSGPEETPRSLAGKRGDSEVARLLGVSEEKRKSGGVAAVPEVAGDRSPAEAVEAAIALLEMQSPNFIKRGGCNSCHNQNLPAAAAALARERGIRAPKTIAQIPLEALERSPERAMNHAVIGSGILYELFGYAATRRPPDEYTDSLVHYLKRIQEKEGYWASGRGNRPPLTADDFITTALTVNALKVYSPEVEQAGTRKRLALAARWLEAAKPLNTQQRAFQLLGLKWAGGDGSVIEKAVKWLAATQRADGGFAQLPTMGSDAYATGEALYALHVAGGMDTGDAVYQKGVRYLLRTQAADGSWHVKTRALPLQPYFESGFPYGQDQWISAAGTSWASMALALTVEPQKLSQR